jgi:hypothetical protein
MENKEFNLDDLQKAFENLSKNTKSYRNFVIHTGPTGAELFHLEMRRLALKPLLPQTTFSKDEKDILMEMINSDKADVEMADIVITQNIKIKN